MFNYESYRFWIYILYGNLPIKLVQKGYKRDRGMEKNSQTKFEVPFFTIVAIIMVIGLGVIPRQMDTPNIFSRIHHEFEGVVVEYRKDGGLFEDPTLKIKNVESEEIINFTQVKLPDNLELGDSVKVIYLKYSKVAAITEYNGSKTRCHLDDITIWGSLIILYLVLAVPVYYLRKIKLEPFFNYQQDYYIHICHDKYVYAMLATAFVKVQMALVILVAMMGHYKVSCDWYWGLLLILNYLGDFILTYLEAKKFIIVNDKFYYFDSKKRIEGNLADLKFVECGDGFIKMLAEEELTIFCKSKKYVDLLMKKMGFEGVVKSE